MNRNACRRFNETTDFDRFEGTLFLLLQQRTFMRPPDVGLSYRADLPSRVTRIDRLKTDIYKQHTMPRYVHRIIHSAWLWLHDLSKNRLAKSDAYISRERVVKNREKITSTSRDVWTSLKLEITSDDTLLIRTFDSAVGNVTIDIVIDNSMYGIVSQIWNNLLDILSNFTLRYSKEDRTIPIFFATIIVWS